MFPNQSTGECMPTKYMFPFESKSKDTGEIVPNACDFSGILYISKPKASLYFQIVFCLSSVNQILSPLPETFTVDISEKSMGFWRTFQIGIAISLSNFFVIRL